jgi:hypothetical protein
LASNYEYGVCPVHSAFWIIEQDNDWAKKGRDLPQELSGRAIMRVPVRADNLETEMLVLVNWPPRLGE